MIVEIDLCYECDSAEERDLINIAIEEAIAKLNGALDFLESTDNGFVIDNS